MRKNTFAKIMLLALLVSPAASGEIDNLVPPDDIAFIAGLARSLQEQSLSINGLIRPQAFVQGELLLRDAKYRYHEPATETGEPPLFVSVGCDVYQIVLTVNAGAVTLVITEADNVTEASIEQGSFIFPAKLGTSAGMFAYALYSNKPIKAFLLKNGDFSEDTQSAEFTAFGYCFSTKPYAVTIFVDNFGNEH